MDGTCRQVSVMEPRSSDSIQGNPDEKTPDHEENEADDLNKPNSGEPRTNVGMNRRPRTPPATPT